MRSNFFRLITLIAASYLMLGVYPTEAGESDQAALITRAYEYGFPLFEKARLAYNFSYNSNNRLRIPVNSFGHRRALADYTDRAITTPNNDTLYSSAVLDLSTGPVSLDIPAFDKRYYSIAFLDSYTNDFAYIGTRTTGGAGGSYLIAGPLWRGNSNPNTNVISAPGNHIIVLVRIMVDGPDDLDAVHKLQDALVLQSTTPTPERSDLIQPVSGDVDNFVAVVNQVLRDDPPPAADAAILRELAAVGVGPGALPLTQAQHQIWTQYLPAAQAALMAAGKQIGPQIEGWQYTPSDIGNFGTDYRTRAVMALQGIGANVPAELTYTIAMADRTGVALDGDRRYRFHLPAGMPPVGAFWSLSIYEAIPKGGFFFGENAIHRYAINSQAKGLVRNADGSLDIIIQKDGPNVSDEANWLPIPAKSFALIMRAYLPQPPMFNGGFRYPGIEPLD